MYVYILLRVRGGQVYLRLWKRVYEEKILQTGTWPHVATECLVTKMDAQKHLPINIRWAFIKRWSIKKWSSRKRCLAAEYAKESLQGHPTLKDIWNWSIMQMHRPNILKNRTYVNITSVQNYFKFINFVFINLGMYLDVVLKYEAKSFRKLQKSISVSIKVGSLCKNPFVLYMYCFVYILYRNYQCLLKRNVITK